MLVLVTDTSGRQGSVALARAGEGPNEDAIEVIETVSLSGGMFSAQLVLQTASLLDKHNLRKSDIGGFVVVSGPGSFTGLRVGLAAIKAFSEVLQKPIVPVSLLEVIALAGESSGKVLSVLDAGRGEVYVGEYDVASGAAHMRREQLLTKDELVSRAQGAIVHTADAALSEMGHEAGISVVVVEAVSSVSIARLGWKKFRARETVSPEQLEANYIRRTDAEIFSKPAS